MITDLCEIAISERCILLEPLVCELAHEFLAEHFPPPDNTDAELWRNAVLRHYIRWKVISVNRMHPPCYPHRCTNIPNRMKEDLHTFLYFCGDFPPMLKKPPSLVLEIAEEFFTPFGETEEALKYDEECVWAEFHDTVYDINDGE